MINEFLLHRPFEMIGGKKIMSPTANIGHGIIVSGLMTTIGLYARKNKIGYAFADNMDVHFPDGNLFRPDFTVICKEKSDIITKNFGGTIEGVPDMVCEVLSKSTRKNDLTIKKDIYESNGVREYWVIDPYTQTVSVYLLRAGKFEFADEYIYYDEKEFSLLDENERADVKFEVPVSIFPGFAVRLKDIFDWYMD